MSTDGRVMFSDPELLAVVEQKRLRGKKELVCLATDGGIESMFATSFTTRWTLVLLIS